MICDLLPKLSNMKTAIIGTGRIAWKLENDPLRYHPCTHAGTIKYLNDQSILHNQNIPFTLTGICDLNTQVMNDFEKWWGGTLNKYSDYYGLIAKEKPEFLIITTYVSSHSEIALFAMSQGVRKILIEKPIALNHQQSLLIQQMAVKTGTEVFVNFERRYHGGYQKIKEYIEKSSPGSIRSIRGQVLTGSGFDPNSETGPLLHDAVHWIDLLVWYFGKPENIQGKIFRNKADTYEEYSSNLLHYKDFSAQLITDGRSNYFDFTLQIDFHDSRIEAGNSGITFYSTELSKKYTGFRDLREVNIYYSKHNPWVQLYETIALNKTPKLIYPLNDAIHGMEIIQTIQDFE